MQEFMQMKMMSTGKRKRKLSSSSGSDEEDENQNRIKKVCLENSRYDEKCLLEMKRIVQENCISHVSIEAICLHLENAKLESLFKAISCDQLLSLVRIMMANVKDNKQTNVKNKLYSMLLCLVIWKQMENNCAIIEQDFIDVVDNLKQQIDEINLRYNKKKSDDLFAETVKLLTRNLMLLTSLITQVDNNVVSINSLLSSCIFTIFNVSVGDFQIAAILLIKKCFEENEEFQAKILNEMFSIIKTIPENYKVVKNFDDSVKLSMSTVLIMCLIQSAATKLPDDEEFEERYKNLVKIGGSLAVTFVNNCCQHKSFRLILDHVTAELVEICNEPEWPAAKLFLHFLAKALTEIFKEKVNCSPLMKAFAIKLLNKIAKKIVQDKREFCNIVEELLVEHDDSSSSDKDGQILEKLLIEYLSSQSLSEINDNCKLVHEIQWHEKVKPLSSGEGIVVTRNQIRGIVYWIDSKRRNYADFHVYLNYVLNACHEKSKKVKKAGVEAFLELLSVDVDGLIMSSSNGAIVSKTLDECISTSPPQVRTSVCSWLETFFVGHPHSFTRYSSCLFTFLNDESANVRIAGVSFLDNFVKQNADVDFPQKKDLFYKMLCLIRDEDTNVQRRAIEFCSSVWFDGEDKNLQSCSLQILLEMIETPNLARNSQLFFREFLKHENMSDKMGTFVDSLIGLLEKDDRGVASLKILLILVRIYPKSLNNQFLSIARLLNKTENSVDFVTEILSAQILGFILPEMENPDVVAFIVFKDKLLEKLKSRQSLDYPMAFLVSLLKLIKKMKLDDKDDSLLKEVFESSLRVVHRWRKTNPEEEAEDLREMTKALCILVCLHLDLKEKLDLEDLLHRQHPKFVADVLHSVCYLLIDNKTILENEAFKKAVEKYLRDKSRVVLTRAVLHTISYSLKNLKTGDEKLVANFFRGSLKDILECLVNSNEDIRHSASQAINDILKSEMLSSTEMDRIIPFLVSMSTDSSVSVNNLALQLLDHLKKIKMWDFSRNSSTSILTSRLLHLNFVQEEEQVRGFTVENGRFRSRCNLFYLLLREDPIKREKFIRSLIEELKKAEKNNQEKLYLVDNLAYFEYRSRDEVFYLLDEIERFVKSASPDGTTLEKCSKEATFVDDFFPLYLVVFLKSYLQVCYGITREKLQKYFSEGTKTENVNDEKTFCHTCHFIPETFLRQDQNLSQNIFMIISIPEKCRNYLPQMESKKKTRKNLTKK